MPPKAKEAKAKAKAVEDKTFGMKNKKGKKGQDFVKQVESQAAQKAAAARAAAGQAVVSKKDEKKKEAEELNLLFKPVTEQKVPQGADPKSVLCAFFKQGQCKKGPKCKFSHDLNIERKGEKRSLYHDGRDEDLEKDTMDNWDQNKLEEVVTKKARCCGGSQAKDGHCLQVLSGGDREEPLRLVLGVPERRRKVHVPPRAAAGICAEEGQECDGGCRRGNLSRGAHRDAACCTRRAREAYARDFRFVYRLEKGPKGARVCGA
eukprot:Opistho-2@88650